MPGKYSHSVVLAHYSSRGIISLPNDRQTEYFTSPSHSRTVSTTTHRQRLASLATDASERKATTQDLPSSTTPRISSHQHKLRIDGPATRRRRKVIIESESDNDHESNHKDEDDEPVIILHPRTGPSVNKSPVAPLPQAAPEPATVSDASPLHQYGRHSMTSERSATSSNARREVYSPRPRIKASSPRSKQYPKAQIRAQLENNKAFESQKARKSSDGGEVSQALRNLLGEEKPPLPGHNKRISLMEFLDSSSSDERRGPLSSHPPVSYDKPLAIKQQPDRARLRHSPVLTRDGVKSDSLAQNHGELNFDGFSDAPPESIHTSTPATSTGGRTTRLTEASSIPKRSLTISDAEELDVHVAPKTVLLYPLPDLQDRSLAPSNMKPTHHALVTRNADSIVEIYTKPAQRASLTSLSSLSDLDLPSDVPTPLTSTLIHKPRLSLTGGSNPQEWGLPPIPHISLAKFTNTDTQLTSDNHDDEGIFDMNIPSEARPEGIFTSGFGHLSSGRDVQYDDAASDTSAAFPPDIGRYKAGDSSGGSPIAELEQMMARQTLSSGQTRRKSFGKQEKLKVTKKLFARLRRI